MKTEESEGLARVLGQRDLSLLVVGSVIGSGIFLKPGGVLRDVGNSVPVALSVWLVGGLLSLMGALTYGEMGAMRPHSGGLYVFIRDSFGRLPAFLYGWSLLLVITTAGIAALSVAFSQNLTEFVALTDAQQKAVAVGVVAVLTTINVLGTRKSADMQNWTTAVKAGAILLMSALLLILARGTSSAVRHVDAPVAMGNPASALAAAMVGVLWAYEGWQSVTFSAGETIDAHRTFPRAFLVGTLAVMGIYLLANVAYVSALGAGGLATTANAGPAALNAVIGGKAAKLLTIAILISVFSAANASFLTGPRVYYAMATDRVFFDRLSEVHPRFGTPATAVIIGGVWAAVLAVSGRFDQLTGYVVFVGWTFYAVGAAAIFVFRKRHPDLHRPYRVPGYPWTPLLFILSAAALVAITIWSKPQDSAVGVAMVLAGIPVYLFWRARSRRIDAMASGSD